MFCAFRSAHQSSYGRGLCSSMFVWLILLITIGCGVSLAVEKPSFDLMLVGGGLKTCSSMSTRNCENKSFQKSTMGELLYSVTQQNIENFATALNLVKVEQTVQVKINKLLLDIYALKPNQSMTSEQLRSAFDRVDGLSVYKALPDPVYYALLDSLEVRQLDQSGQRKREVTALNDTSSQASIDIYQRFVEEAAKRKPDTQAKPTIVVVTASSRDPFEVADFYLSVFNDAGAQTDWLPLDKTYQQAQQLNTLGFDGCAVLTQLRAQNLSFNREQIYPQRTAKQAQYCQQPQLMLNAIANAQGIFFNGGDQSLTLAALKLPDGSDSAELALIKQLNRSGKLVVGGTSAGTAVQAGGVANSRPIPMITNGDSEFAMARGAFATPPPSQRCASGTECEQGLQNGDLTYLASGGTGLFTLGLLDTHFSERDRETRLAVFSSATRQNFAFGVDEATALLVSNPIDGKYNMQVLGASGVFIVDRSVVQESFIRQAGTSNHVISGMAHYIAAGSNMILEPNTGQWQFSLAGESVTTKKSIRDKSEYAVWRRAINRACGSLDEIKWQQFGNQYLLKASEVTQFARSLDKKQCQYTHLPYVISYLHR